jgi:hypothetical protein
MTNVDTLPIAAHRSNISRYKRLLRTHLTELERAFVDLRLEEEKSALARLIGEQRLKANPSRATHGSATSLRAPASQTGATSHMRRFGVSGAPCDVTWRCA